MPGSCPGYRGVPSSLCGLWYLPFRRRDLSRRRYLCLLRKRLLHVVIVALNYIHGGVALIDVSLLSRSPNRAQRAAHRRLWALITTCDTPGSELPLVPGRSGPEFIARLTELEKYIQSSGFFEIEGYGGGPYDYELEKVGDIRPSPQSLPYLPYSALNSDRLKLVGTGAWEMSRFLQDELWLPFLEPKVLHHGDPPDFASGPNLKVESKEENLKLAKIWSAKNLLALTPIPPHLGAFARVFNAYNNETVDRQIGDRRLANSTEHSIQGPSKHLPGGYLMTNLEVPRGCKLTGSVTDRKDFYHQASATFERASQNVLPFRYELSEFEGTLAYADYMGRKHASRKREDVGDLFGRRKRSILVDKEEVYPAFRSLLQGDHLGVEFALSAHATLLQEAGLLQEESRVEGGKPFPMASTYDGLVIDDYFALSVEKVGVEVHDTKASKALLTARAAYEKEEVLGSPEKDVSGSSHLKVVGAEINSSATARSRGVVTVSAPCEKRIALSVLSLRIASLPVLSSSLAARLAGNWTSIFLFRRCLTSILAGVYTIGTKEGKSGSSEVFKLPRSIAEELVLSAVLSWVAASDVSTPIIGRIFATDASLHKGAVVSRIASRDIARTLWLGGDKKGGYTMLDEPPAAMLRSIGEETCAPDPPHLVGPMKVFNFFFDFVEICGGSGRVSSHMASLEHTVAPPIDISDSVHYDLRNIRLVEWIIYMITYKRFRSCMVEPVCTTFSPAAHPAVRSYRVPLGYDRLNPKTLLGNMIAFRCLAIAWSSAAHGAPTLCEQPRLSKMAWLSAWQFLLTQKGFEEAIVASCRFGSPHRKEFRMLGWGIDMRTLDCRCEGGHSHIPIAGKYTKPSAEYVPKLAKHLAQHFHSALLKKERESQLMPKVSGLESVVANDALMTGAWKLDASWKWKKPHHINVLESQAYVTMLRIMARTGRGARFSALLDSRVAKGSRAKGRSSAKALKPTLSQSAALQVAYGLYPALGFAPTRLNVADDPTRDHQIRLSSSHSITSALSLSQCRTLHAMVFSRSVANWVRLYILASCLDFAGAFDPILDFTLESWSIAYHLGFRWILIWISILLVCSLRIWISAGLRRSVRRTVAWIWILHFFILLSSPSCFSGAMSRQAVLLLPEPHSSNFQHSWIESILPQPLPLGFPLGCAAMPLLPTGAEESAKAARRAATELKADRVLLPQTRSRREALLDSFEKWLVEKMRITLEQLLDGATTSPELVSECLIEYGKELYYAGKPYGRYSETINAVVSRKVSLKKALTGAWDLAFAWVVDEPHAHHPAMPLSIVLAFASLSLLWGWSVEAALLLMTWTGILRIGEVLAAVRGDLILPQDSAPGIEYALLQIRLPKTRGSAARHQSARIDPVDVVALLSSVFGGKDRSEKLWPLSGQTLRRHFQMLQKAIGLPVTKVGSQAPYDLASLRPGGATFLLNKFEDAELVRRRGRWISSRVMEIYLQEVSVATFAERLAPSAFRRIEDLSIAFPTTLEKALFFRATAIPEISWPRLW